jgi:hypothetical protein
MTSKAFLSMNLEKSAVLFGFLITVFDCAGFCKHAL